MFLKWLEIAINKRNNEFYLIRWTGKILTVLIILNDRIFSVAYFSDSICNAPFATGDGCAEVEYDFTIENLDIS
jgi:hypothetical protein